MIPRPLHDVVIVERSAVSEMAGPNSLIVLPETARPWRGDTATVLAVGPGRKNAKGIRKTSELKPGDRVAIAELAGIETRVDGRLLTFLCDDDILGVLDHDTTAA